MVVGARREQNQSFYLLRMGGGIDEGVIGTVGGAGQPNGAFSPQKGNSGGDVARGIPRGIRTGRPRPLCGAPGPTLIDGQSHITRFLKGFGERLPVGSLPS